MNIRRTIRNWFWVLFLGVASGVMALTSYYAWMETLYEVPLDYTTLWFMYMVSIIFTVAAGWFSMMTWYQLKKAIAGER